MLHYRYHHALQPSSPGATILALLARGVKNRSIVYRYAFKNALIPVVTIGGATVVALLNGVIITETIFNYPGIGSIAAQAAAGDRSFMDEIAGKKIAAKG